MYVLGTTNIRLINLKPPSSEAHLVLFGGKKKVSEQEF